MALTEPFDVLSDFPGWTTEFDLYERQEQSRTAAGTTKVKDLGPPLWRMKVESKRLRPNELDYWRARLKYMEGGLYTLIGFPLSRFYPILYPNGSWPTGVLFDGVSARLNTVNANRKGIKLDHLPASYRVSVGDYISIEGDLHQAMEAATANGSGVTTEFEVRPHVWPGVTGGSSPDTLVAVKQPSCLMTIVPGTLNTSASTSGWGSVSFEAMEAR